MNYRLAYVFCVSLSFIFLGCSTFSPPEKCIRTVLVSSLSKYPLHFADRSDSRSVTISNFKSGCGGSSPELPGGNGNIGINMTFTVPEALKSTGKERKAIIPLFVALLDKDDNVLDRYDENVEITLADQAQVQIHKVTYTPPEGVDISSENHRILVGFKEGAQNISTPVHHVAKNPPLSKVKKKKSKSKRKVKKSVDQ